MRSCEERVVRKVVRGELLKRIRESPLMVVRIELGGQCDLLRFGHSTCKDAGQSGAGELRNSDAPDEKQSNGRCYNDDCRSHGVGNAPNGRR